MLSGLCREGANEREIQLESECSMNYYVSTIQFPSPFVCWFVKSPVSVSKDKTRSASGSSESGSDDVGGCSVEKPKQKIEAKGNYDWNINDTRPGGLTRDWLD